MSGHTVQLVLHYDGAAFAGWQVQPEQRTVQGEVERVLTELCGDRVVAQGAGRTDAGVHARGQAVGVRVPERWPAARLRRAMNALLPRDVWIAEAHAMRPEFHARHSATARRYRYVLSGAEAALSPFRRRWEWFVRRPIAIDRLHDAARELVGEHAFFAFAVRGTAPIDDDHRCVIRSAVWAERDGGLTFTIEANRFLHHMVRFLVGTMVDIASDRRDPNDMGRLLRAPHNGETSAPAPAHALCLEYVEYPRSLYLDLAYTGEGVV